MLEREVFQFAAQPAHAQPMSDRRIDVHGLLGDAAALFRAQEFERSHVVQPVGEFDQHHAHVVDHRQQHFPHVLRLLLLARDVTDVGNFGETFDQMRHVFAEICADSGSIGQGVFYYIMQEPG